jgi:ribosomal-protein-alanine N-acetyltransferase
MTRAVLYRWKLKPGREDEFQKAWAKGTTEIHTLCGSHGAALHKDQDGIFWSYARWPGEDARKNCFTKNDFFSQDCFISMQDCIAERFDEILLDVLEDQLDTKTTRYDVPTLSTKRLILRAMVMEDDEAMAPALCDKQNMLYWGRDALKDLDEVRDYIRWNVANSNVQCFAIALKDAPELALGWAILMNRKDKEAELGYMMRPDVHGHGYAREAVQRVLKHGFEARSFNRIYADTDPENKSSIGLLENLGFKREAHLREYWHTHLGPRDSYIYGMLKSDKA